MTPDPAGTDERLLVVTTRSRLRRLRHFPTVLGASLQVRRQLADTDGLVCGASMVAGPTEFWTITVWRSRYAMQQFSRDGAHGLVMWNYPRWLSSLWVMRWRPDGAEAGSWGGVRLAPAATTATERTAGPVAEVLAAMDTVTHEDSAVARRGRQVQGVRGALVRIRSPLWQMPRVLLGLRRLRRRLLDDTGLLRGVVGVGRPGEVYFLGVCFDRAGVDRVLDDPWLAGAARRWPGGFWSIALSANGEFGTWDGQRLRRGPRAGTMG